MHKRMKFPGCPRCGSRVTKLSGFPWCPTCKEQVHPEPYRRWPDQAPELKKTKEFDKDTPPVPLTEPLEPFDEEVE